MKKNTNREKEKISNLVDSAQDVKKMKPETTIINLPDVKDIPGQENIRPMPLGELADSTISSSDEEGDNLFADDEPEDDNDSNVSSMEKDDLDIAANNMPTEDDINLREAALDNADADGTPLNEESFKKNLTASDLDIPGAEEDNQDEEIGEEDEENNEYSLGGDNNDDIPQDDL